jgi:hypothetical protein
MWTYLIFPEAEAFTIRNPPGYRANISNDKLNPAQCQELLDIFAGQ